MQNFETVDYRVDEQVAIITLNRPKARNSLTAQMREELYRAMQQANNDETVRVVMLAGAGKGFCAGADLVEEYPDADHDGFITQQLRTEYHPVLQAITESKKPYICAVNGAAAGIGAALAMACDLVVMAEDAFFYSAFGAIALIPDGGTHWQLARYLGSKRAFEMIAESQRLPAAECIQLGMANRLAAPEHLQEEALGWAKSLSNQAPLTLQYSKQLLREAANLTLVETMDREAQIQNIHYRSEDFREGARAFFEKRAPKFTGK
ncbi:enoyl-CoA hydratase/isomerase family protein [Biformimicrobium ophioploci]|uniref:2-(1,2-epoxy-1,2-dihydrophenyl)acetyl-CoA isomerase PaaG n=1 Tax=Biformimicrobium ophioploci TaxID=3036711 RepID=A0ABQ6M2C4_9GAMM|nr:enoyl-CoA hydratase/isomerase family protein [Microbulbifer sp. NKW57]GMG88415.1 2-(1,2-epoxy-1,2-dihydrophenyl)acetyl-CoA isomerase PaaG [Microbulbifer sp. NKW57]